MLFLGMLSPCESQNSQQFPCVNLFVCLTVQGVGAADVEAAPKKDKRKAHVLSDDEENDAGPPTTSVPAPAEGATAGEGGTVVPELWSDEEADEAIRRQNREQSE